MEEHNGEVPQNARINISYKGKKPKVSFKYPVDKKNTQTEGSMRNYVIIIWILALMPGYIVVGLLGSFDVFEEILMAEVIYILIILLGWIPLYFPFKKKWDSKYPDFMAWTSRKKYRRFTEKDSQEKDGRMFVELPIFNNIVCDFEATRDFNKYMEEFDITEHKFKYYKKRKCKITKKKKRFSNETLFYARWYFKEKPKDGYLDVIFK